MIIECEKCHQIEAEYNYKEHKYVCKKCGHEEEIKPRKCICSCGECYLKYTWFDPSGCSRCKKSFVD
jgi:hypothetical protein